MSPPDTCALCYRSDTNDITGRLQRTPDGSVVAHYNCMLFSPKVISIDSQEDVEGFDFAIESVLDEIKRGRNLRCNFCKKRGATVGCDIRSCRRNYHFPCVIEAKGSPSLDEYVVYCFEHKSKRTDNGIKNTPRGRKRKRFHKKDDKPRPTMSSDRSPEESDSILSPKVKEVFSLRSKRLTVEMASPEDYQNDAITTEDASNTDVTDKSTSSDSDGDKTSERLPGNNVHVGPSRSSMEEQYTTEEQPVSFPDEEIPGKTSASSSKNNVISKLKSKLSTQSSYSNIEDRPCKSDASSCSSDSLSSEFSDGTILLIMQSMTQITGNSVEHAVGLSNDTGLPTQQIHSTNSKETLSSQPTDCTDASKSIGPDTLVGCSLHFFNEQPANDLAAQGTSETHPSGCTSVTEPESPFCSSLTLEKDGNKTEVSTSVSDVSQENMESDVSAPLCYNREILPVASPSNGKTLQNEKGPKKGTISNIVSPEQIMTISRNLVTGIFTQRLKSIVPQARNYEPLKNQGSSDKSIKELDPVCQEGSKSITPKRKRSQDSVDLLPNRNPQHTMKRKETNVEATDPAIISAIRATGNISVREAKTFWQNQRKEGNVDVLFKEVQSKLQLLWQKIKDRSATNQDYVGALMFVKEADVGNYETYHCDQSFAEEQLEDTGCPSVRTEEPLPTPNPSEVEKPLPCSEPESNDVPHPFVATSFFFEEHKCGQKCLSNVNPYFNKRENPLKFPVMCHFQRRHAKSSVISRQLDVIYKAPCGRSLRNIDDVRRYLSQTECRFLSLDHFSFNTYLQLDRNPVKNQVVFQEADISRDAELVPVPYCNEIDNTRPAPFTYRKSPWPRGYSINNFTDLFIGCCDCTDGCTEVSKCACLQLTTRELTKDVTLPKQAPGYKDKRLQTPVPAGLYECNVSCKCDRKMCENRVVQHGLQQRLQVFKTKEKGWGVRCLDDLDKGTFVCIYTGRILMKTVDVNIVEDSVQQTPTKKPTSTCPRNRCSHLDSEITDSPSGSSTSQTCMITLLPRERAQTELKRKNLSHVKEEKLNFLSIKRPQTKTSILQKRRRQLMEEGTVTRQHSSDDELFTPPTSPKKPHSCDHEDKEENVKVIDTTRDNRVLDNKAGYVSDERISSIPPNSQENLYFLDASPEGNIGRFLNHSCSPNLFVQHVFVETHHKNFPWVAFFTKSFIKAGTELTWDYNYDIGSNPEKEIPCTCGQRMCKKIII